MVGMIYRVGVVNHHCYNARPGAIAVNHHYQLTSQKTKERKKKRKRERERETLRTMLKKPTRSKNKVKKRKN